MKAADSELGTVNATQRNAGWLVNNLEKISYENRDRATEGWVPTSLKEGGVPYDAIFEVMDELFCAKVGPGLALDYVLQVD